MADESAKAPAPAPEGGQAETPAKAPGGRWDKRIFTGCACLACAVFGFMLGFGANYKAARYSCGLVGETLHELTTANSASLAQAVADFMAASEARDKTTRQLYASILAVNATLEDTASRLSAAKAGRPLPPRKGGFVVVDDDAWRKMIEKNVESADKWIKDHPVPDSMAPQAKKGKDAANAQEYGTKATAEALDGK